MVVQPVKGSGAAVLQEWMTGIEEGQKMTREKLWKKAICWKNADVAVMVILILSLCLLHAVDTCYSLSFGVTDGVFQNYNVVRRLLDGQVPYRDFTLYLGLGHLFSGSFFTWLFGGSGICRRREGIFHVCVCTGGDDRPVPAKRHRLYHPCAGGQAPAGILRDVLRMGFSVCNYNKRDV